MKDKQESVSLNDSKKTFKSYKKFEKREERKNKFLYALAQDWKKSKLGLKIIAITYVLVLLFTVTGLGYVWSILQDYNYNPEIAEKTPEELGFENVIDQRVVNVALFGIDSRSPGFKGNSDSIMVLSIDTEKKTVKIVSIVRDTLVPIEIGGKIKYRKINSAYQSGGPVLAIKTLNQNFGLDISEYATVNFNGMADIIDAVGGIEAELIKGEVVSVNKSIYALNGCIYDVCQRLKIDPEPYYIHKPGKYLLNGIQAVAYSRIRKTKNVWGTNNDYGRTDRQRHVMEQLFNKALTLPKEQYYDLVTSLMPCTETSISIKEALGLAWDVLLENPTFAQSRIPLSQYQMPGKNIKGVGDCVYYDLDYAKELLHAFFYEGITPEEYIKLNGVKKNDWYAQAIGEVPPPAPTPDTKPPEENETPNPDQNGGTGGNGGDGGNGDGNGDAVTPENPVPTPNPDEGGTEE